MSEPIITVEGLGKRYRLGASRSNERYTALRDVVAEAATRPFRRLSNKFKSKNGSDESGSTSTQNLNSSRTEEFWALRDINFEVKRGEVLGIIGRNGAGKSTLLKILSRITDPTEGRIKIRGRVASLLEVGTGFHPELTGRENIYLNGAILGMHRHEIKAKFDEIVAFAEVEKFLDTPVKRYSSGMYVRLAFAVAAHLEPEILVVDEVLAVGDTEFQKKCLGKMQDVAQGGRTVLFVSHNMSAVKLLCTRAVLLTSGSLILDGDSSIVTQRYGEIFMTTNQSHSLPHRIVRGNGFAIHPPEVKFSNFGGDNESLLLTFKVESSEARTNIGFGIALKTHTGFVVSKLSPAMTNFVIPQLVGSLNVTCRIRNVSNYIGGGLFFLDAWLSVPRIEILLEAERIGEVNIPPRDVYGFGREFSSSDYGVVPLVATFGVLSTSQSPRSKSHTLKEIRKT